MGAINRIPRGYIDLLGQTTSGETPSEARNFVQPILNMDPLYLAQTLSWHNDTVAHTAVSTSVEVDVPQNETWLLYSWGVRTATGASSDFEEWALEALTFPRPGADPGQFPQLDTSGLLTGAGAAQFIVYGKTFGQVIPLTAGTTLRAILYKRDGNASRTTRWQLMMARLKG